MGIAEYGVAAHEAAAAAGEPSRCRAVFPPHKQSPVYLSAVRMSGKYQIHSRTRRFANNRRVMAQQHSRIAPIRAAERALKIVALYHKIVHTRKPQPFSVAIKRYIFIRKHAYARIGQRSRHTRAVGPVIVVAEHGINAERRTQQSQCTRTPVDILTRVRNVVPGKNDQIRRKRICVARCGRDFRLAQKRAVVYVGKLNYPETFELRGQSGQSYYLPGDFHLVGFKRGRVQHRNESAARSRLPGAGDETGKYCVFHPARLLIRNGSGIEPAACRSDGDLAAMKRCGLYAPGRAVRKQAAARLRSSEQSTRLLLIR
jgi:hypothetical protein